MLKVSVLRTRKRSNRLMGLMFSGILLLVIYFIVYSYITELTNSKEAVLDRLKSIALTSSLMIDGDLHLELSQTYLNKNDIVRNDEITLYSRLHETLENIRRTNNLTSAVYTLVYNQSKQQFEFIGTSSQYPYYRHSYEKFPETLLSNMNTGGVINEYESENGKWLSAFAPIKDNNGKTVALIQVDQDFGDFIMSARITLLKNSLIALIIILPFTFLLFAYIKATLDKEEHQKQMLADKNEEIQTQNEFIRENNNKLAAAKLLIEQKNEELNIKVEERTKELKDANYELHSFLYRSSHDMQGPLTTLMGLNQLASSEVQDSKALGYIYMINDTTKKLYNTIRSITNVYEIKNKPTINEHIEIDPLIQNLIIRFKKELDEKGIRLINELQPNLKAKADREILIMVISELFKNGIEFNSALNGESPYIRISGSQTDKYVSISIEDNGIGINPESRDLIFEMFQKGSESSQGAGLGLYAAKTGMNKLKGFISLNTNIAERTSFELKLPAA